MVSNLNRAIVVIGTILLAFPSAHAQRAVTSAVCSEYGAVDRGGRCIYPALADCRRRPSEPSMAEAFQCPTNTTCEPNTGLCVCIGEYRNTNDRDNILTCIRGRAYGQPCSQMDTCLSPLTCSTRGTCDCPTPAVWNLAESRCYDDRICSSQRRGTFFEVETQRCKCLLDNTSCLGRGYKCPTNAQERHEFQNLIMATMCKCSSGFSATDDKRRCVRPKNYDESCNTATGEFCDSGLLLTCLNGTCACDPYSKVWDPASKSCKLKAGRTCQLEFYDLASLERRGNCGPNMFCRPTSPDAGLQCVCSPNYSQAADGRCVGTYLTTCLTREDCAEGYDCMEGVCNCRDQINKVYDPISAATSGGLVPTAVCKSSVGSRCSGNQECVVHSHCNRQDVCECDEEYKEDTRPNYSGHCTAAFTHGSPCNAGECDSEKGYTCRSARCECADSEMTFVGKEQGCLAKVGSRCGTIQVEGRGQYVVKCESSSTCSRMARVGLRAEPEKFKCVKRKQEFTGSGRGE